MTEEKQNPQANQLTNLQIVKQWIATAMQLSIRRDNIKARLKERKVRNVENGPISQNVTDPVKE